METSELNAKCYLRWALSAENIKDIRQTKATRIIQEIH